MSEQSENIAELALALSKAQAVIGGAKKDSKNPFFKSDYADLESVWMACRKELTDNGLSVIQTMEPNPEGVTVVTTLAHSSGQWMRGRLNLHPTKNDPQGIGSAITYGRRYALAAIVGVYQTDDDGNAASGKTDKPSKQDAKPQPVTTKGKFSEFTTHQAEDGETEVWGKVGDKVVFSSTEPNRTSLIDLHESGLDAEFVLMNTGRTAKNGTPIYSVHMVSPVPTQVPDDKLKPAMAVSIKSAKEARQ